MPLEYDEINELDLAASINDADLLEIEQSGVSKKVPISTIKAATAGFSNPNDIINGALDDNGWQIGTGFIGITDDDYFADNFVYIKNGGAIQLVNDIEKASDVAFAGVKNAMKITCTTKEDAVAADEYMAISQYIEGINFRKYVGDSGTISFEIYSTVTGICSVAVRNIGLDRSYITEFEIFDSLTVEKKIITIPFDFAAGGTWDYTNDIGLEISIVLMAGTDWQGATETWINDNKLASANQVNLWDNTANVVYISKVKLELGESATKFVNNDDTYETTRRQGHFEKTYNTDVDPGTASVVGSKQTYNSVLNVANHSMKLTWQFHTKKIKTPTVVAYTAGGTINKVDMENGEVAEVITKEGMSSVVIGGQNGAASGTRTLSFQAIADARLSR